MKSLDDIFVAEFKAMCGVLKSRNSYGKVHPIHTLELPERFINEYVSNESSQLFIKGIDDPYFSALNNTQVAFPKHPKMFRRLKDENGEYYKDNGNWVIETVEGDDNCVAVVSPIAIETPDKLKKDKHGRIARNWQDKSNRVIWEHYKGENPSEHHYERVDCGYEKINGEDVLQYTYLIPKDKCYKVRECALYLTNNKLNTGSYHVMYQVTLRDGTEVWLTVVERSIVSRQKNGRLLATNKDPEYLIKLANEVIKYWEMKGIMFNIRDCEVEDNIKGVHNVALMRYDSTIEYYEEMSEEPISTPEEFESEYDKTQGQQMTNRDEAGFIDEDYS